MFSEDEEIRQIAYVIGKIVTFIFTMTFLYHLMVSVIPVKLNKPIQSFLNGDQYVKDNISYFVDMKSLYTCMAFATTKYSGLCEEEKTKYYKEYGYVYLGTNKNHEDSFITIEENEKRNKKTIEILNHDIEILKNAIKENSINKGETYNEQHR